MTFIDGHALVAMRTILEKQIVTRSHVYMNMVHVTTNPCIKIFQNVIFLWSF